jgi:glycosyltransferase involved in cell wall biosynthesis
LVPAAVRSVLSQTYDQLEVIVVDDGSATPASEALAHVDDARLRVERLHPSVGVAAARNRGIAVARGELIGFCDDDDEWLPTMLERLVEALATNSDVNGSRPTVAFCNSVIEEVEAGTSWIHRASAGYLNTLATALEAPKPYLSATLAPRQLFSSQGCFDPALRNFQDYDMLLRWAAAGVRTIAVDDALFIRNYHLASLSTQHESHMRSEAILQEKWLPAVTDALGPLRARRWAARRWVQHLSGRVERDLARSDRRSAAGALVAMAPHVWAAPGRGMRSVAKTVLGLGTYRRIVTSMGRGIT